MSIAFPKSSVALIALIAVAAWPVAGYTTPRVTAKAAARTNGAARVQGDAHAKALLYVGNIDAGPGVGNIFVYSSKLHANDEQPTQTISVGTQRPDGMWVDGTGTLYVANVTNGAPSYVDEFHPGDSAPFLKITDGLFAAQTVAVAADRTVYVNNRGQNDAFVSVYAPGSVHLSRTFLCTLRRIRWMQKKWRSTPRATFSSPWAPCRRKARPCTSWRSAPDQIMPRRFSR